VEVALADVVAAAATSTPIDAAEGKEGSGGGAPAPAPASTEKIAATQCCYKMLLVVRTKPADPPKSRILLVLATNGYLAYNNWGGHSLYGFHSTGGKGGCRDPDVFSKTFTQDLIANGGVQGVSVHPDRPGHGHGPWFWS